MAEWSSMNDIFEKIIAREIPADIVYEDEHVLCFLDINPIRKGHTLIIPKNKFVTIFDGDTETLAHMMVVAQKIAQALQSTIDAKGVNIHMNNGYEADQDIPYAHIHVIPRFARGEAFVVPQHESYSEGESVLLREKIKTAIA
jgi:histidine triad (HIT) family protein